MIDQGGGLCLWSAPPAAAAPQSEARAALPPQGEVSVPPASMPAELLGLFDEQLRAGRLTSPAWDSCLGTLALLHAAGLGESTLQLMQRQIEQQADQGSRKATKSSERQKSASAAKAEISPSGLRDMPAGTEFLESGWSPRMLVVPAGRFLMGSAESEPGRRSTDGPLREVIIKQPFAIGRTAVTFDDYERFTQHTGLSCPADQGWGRGGRPVINVSWHDAQVYIAWLNQQLGLSTSEGYRLPTEQEWEYAARAGSYTPFWWGDSLVPQQANYDGNYIYEGGGRKGAFRQQTVEADAFEPNGWGLHNVLGNVWEWVQDPWTDHGPSASQAVETCPEPEAQVRRVVRGGSWLNHPAYLRCASRYRFAAGTRSDSVGFRLARNL